PQAHTLAHRLRNEYVFAVRGKVAMRPEGTANPQLATGEIEVLAQELQILNECKTLPFSLDLEGEVTEQVRLQYRYLDLRRPALQRNFILRHRVVKALRDFFDQEGFLEIETPFLTKSTPEGARDYLVPSRVNPGKFYALPQSPQCFKQILMIAGFDKYYQIVRCFRDEDLRADRQPEFTQIDIEMSFPDEETIFDLVERMLAHVFAVGQGREIVRPFPRMTYREALERYGVDKPDIRFGMELRDISDLVGEEQFQVFTQVLAAGGQVKGICVQGGAELSRREIDELTTFVKGYKAKGLAWFKITAQGMQSPITRFFSLSTLEKIQERLQGQEGDLLLFVADQPAVVAEALGHLRLHLAQQRKLIPEQEYRFLWVTDFPLLEYDAEEKRYVAMHHPFTSPREEDIPLFDTAPEQMKARAYDLVLNGYEIGGGSIRIHRRAIQEQMFRTLGIPPQEAEEKFGFLLEALDYGAPPHGGIALGLDRLLMILAGANSIREVIAFPKTQKAVCPLTGAPTAVQPRQLKELGIKLDLPTLLSSKTSG
ncbi:MAG: aspartate--tRNA ligase, partial [Nitrospinota bacterium]